MKAEVQFLRNIGVGPLFVGKLNAEANGMASRLGRAAVRRLHDSRTASRTNYETPRLFSQSQGPLCNAARELARLLVVARHLQVRSRGGDFCPPFLVVAAARIS